jgi:hypothetical protein
MKKFTFKSSESNNKLKDNTLWDKDLAMKVEDALGDQFDGKVDLYQTYGTVEESKILKNKLGTPLQLKDLSIPVSEQYGIIDEEYMDDEIMNTRLRDIPLLGSTNNLDKDTGTSCETGRFPNCDKDPVSEELTFRDESETNRMTFGKLNNEICINIEFEDTKINHNKELTPLKNRSKELKEYEASVILK